MSESVPNGPTAGHFISEQMLNTMLDEYYALRGWDAQGKPLAETLRKFGLMENPTPA
jgi:aldehyde:ferredoxin oxidoreductase